MKQDTSAFGPLHWRVMRSPPPLVSAPDATDTAPPLPGSSMPSSTKATASAPTTYNVTIDLDPSTPRTPAAPQRARRYRPIASSRDTRPGATAVGRSTGRAGPPCEDEHATLSSAPTSAHMSHTEVARGYAPRLPLRSPGRDRSTGSGRTGTAAPPVRAGGRTTSPPPTPARTSRRGTVGGLLRRPRTASVRARGRGRHSEGRRRRRGPGSSRAARSRTSFGVRCSFG